jgi:hypothetical protein
VDKDGNVLVGRTGTRSSLRRRLARMSRRPPRADLSPLRRRPSG